MNSSGYSLGLWTTHHAEGKSDIRMVHWTYDATHDVQKTFETFDSDIICVSLVG